MQKYKGEYIAVQEMRKHLAWYTAGMPNSSKFRGRINSMETMDELLKGVDEIFGVRE
jgi:tRNA-dihydrouridine synthase